MIKHYLNNPFHYVEYVIGLLLLVGFYLASTYHYLLFHSLIEISSIIIASGVFMLTWNSRHFVKNDYYLLRGVLVCCRFLFSPYFCLPRYGDIGWWQRQSRNPIMD
ncbi:MAG TPA: hypothetical protein EYP59_04000 [Thiotrichaceae bacterium]|nr:hypothetical protein [Thiotrichaceae bacterium]